MLTGDFVVVGDRPQRYSSPMKFFAIFAILTICVGCVVIIYRRRAKEDAFNRAETEKLLQKPTVFPLTEAWLVRQRALDKTPTDPDQ